LNHTLSFEISILPNFSIKPMRYYFNLETETASNCSRGEIKLVQNRVFGTSGALHLKRGNAKWRCRETNV